MTDKATLSFQMHFHSFELSSLELPIEVRRPNFSLVTRGRSNGTVDVAPGTYLVLCNLPAGQQLTSHVEVKAGERLKVDLIPNDEDASPSENMELNHFMRRQVERSGSVLWPTLDKVLESLPAQIQLSISGASRTGVFALEGMPEALALKLGSESPFSYRRSAFAAAETVAEAPVELSVRWFMGNVFDEAVEKVDGGTVLSVDKSAIELPRQVISGPRPVICQLQQAGLPPLNMCIPLLPMGYAQPPPVLTLLAPESGFPRFRPNVQLQHSVANLLANYLRGYMLEEARETVASETLTADELLHNKLQDPIAAAVGAYAILRVGNQSQKEELEKWSSNLMNWFPWMPDGAVIRGEQLARSGLHAEALAAFVELSARGLPLFSQGLTYAVDRLRLYVDKSESISRQFAADLVQSGRKLLNRLKPFATFSDFDRTWLTFTGTDAKSPSNS